MPLFGANSNKAINYRARFEHKMCIAKQTPEPIFDLSDCDLDEVPSGVVAMCRVFRKEILDLRSNRLNRLPEDISLLSNLKVLNLQDNKLKKLPQAIKNMKSLQVLNLKGNKFSSFPCVICDLPSLQVLYLNSNDKLTILPKELCEVSTLKTIELDADNFCYPSPEICKEGTEAIMKFLCAESGKEYSSPLSSDLPDSDTTTDSATWESQQIDTILPATFDLHQRAKEQRQLNLIKMEEEMRDKQESQAQVAADTQVRRQKLLEDVAEEQERLEDEILEVQSRKEKDKVRLLSTLCSLEDDSAKLIEQLIAINEKSKNTEILLDLMEKDRKEVEELFSLKQEELENLRKKEVIYAMKEMLKAEEKQRLYEADRQELAKQLCGINSTMSNDAIHNILLGHERDQLALIHDLLEEEKYQKQAFEVLLLQRDQRRAGITHQITLIEQELTKLTTAELKRKDLRLNVEINVLAERRSVLAVLLSNLLNEKSNREEELKKRICDMDAYREEEMKDFWLIQYQRLMDRKPQKIVELERTLDPSIITILSDAGAQSYIALFAAKQITLPTLLKMEKKDLKRIGVIHDDVCNNIIQSANSPSNLKQIDTEQETYAPTAPPSDMQPSAPPFDYIEEPSTTKLFPTAEIKIWCQTECVVCMDTESQAVFLPCGHVCCCWICAEPLSSCPMCRADVASRFLLNISGTITDNINM